MCKTLKKVFQNRYFEIKQSWPIIIFVSICHTWYNLKSFAWLVILSKREKLRFDMSAVEETPSVGSQESDTGISSEMKELGEFKGREVDLI